MAFSAKEKLEKLLEFVNKEEELLTEIRDLLKIQAGIEESAEKDEREKVTK